VIKVEIFDEFDFFKDEVRKFFGNPMTTDDNRSSIESSGGKPQMNGSNVLKDVGNDKTN
jgi:hypothetical protein